MILTAFSIVKTTISVVKTVWPFLREMFFDGKTFWQVLKENKFATFILVLLLASLSLNYLSIKKLIVLKAVTVDANQSKVVPIQVGPPPPIASAVAPANQASGPASSADELMDQHLDSVTSKLNNVYNSSDKAK